MVTVKVKPDIKNINIAFSNIIELFNNKINVDVEKDFVFLDYEGNVCDKITFKNGMVILNDKIEITKNSSLVTFFEYILIDYTTAENKQLKQELNDLIIELERNRDY